MVNGRYMPYVYNGRIDGFRSLLECQKQKGCYKIHHCWCNHNYIRTWEHFIFLHIQATMNKEQQRQRIGTDIAELRKQRGMTQQQVADIAQMQRNHISRIEAGRYSVGFDTLQTIAEALDADIRIVPRE